VSYAEEEEFLASYEEKAKAGVIVDTKEIGEVYQTKVGHRISSRQICHVLECDARLGTNPTPLKIQGFPIGGVNQNQSFTVEHFFGVKSVRIQKTPHIHEEYEGFFGPSDWIRTSGLLNPMEGNFLPYPYSKL